MTAAVQATPTDGIRLRRIKRFARNPIGMAAAAVLLSILVLAVFARQLAPYDPNLIQLSETLLPPSGAHLLGTDASGRDVLSRLLWGAQVSLQAGAIMIGTAILCGVPTGLIAGYSSRWFDGVANWCANLLMSLPEILVIIVVITSLGSGLTPTMVTLGVLASPDLFRLTRSVVVNVRDELYIDAARVSGLGSTRIIFRHILSVVLGPLLVRASFVFGLAIIVQSGLEFLGFGDPSRPSWGGMLSEAFQTIYRAPELVIAPGAAIGLTVMALVVFGAAMADALGADRGDGTGKAKQRRASAAGLAEPSLDVSTIEGAVVPAEDALLQIANLRVTYPGDGDTEKPVVRGISLHVDRGEVLGLVGESGSGKSQTSFGILGLLPPEARVSAARMTLGDATLIGASEQQLQALRGTRMAYVPQEPMSNLDPSFTIGTQLTKPMRHKLGIGKAEATQRARELLDRVGIPDPVRTMAAYPHQLSGGMAQRVLIAGAVSCDPELLIADEPTTALDVTVQADVLNLLRDLQRERNMAMILVTHNLGVVADICDRVAVMQDGVIVEQRGVRELFAAPQHPYTRMLLDATLEDARPRSQRPTGNGAL
ncbi:dipeptide/oligopeptide/nickel ABC transporter permease/ATP-binding protein [Agrococcus citreus]|uniref:Dipeptide/oligopeptide/nickel ABC transporter permease/ATP-binding protein n=1 Tax=Agrococcus citreus TaxID=84643 RepID=A0ABN1YPC3_9MICO